MVRYHLASSDLTRASQEREIGSENRGVFATDLIDFKKSEETALKKCLSFTLSQNCLKINLHAVAIKLMIQWLPLTCTCVPTKSIFPLQGEFEFSEVKSS